MEDKHETPHFYLDAIERLSPEQMMTSIKTFHTFLTDSSIPKDVKEFGSPYGSIWRELIQLRIRVFNNHEAQITQRLKNDFQLKLAEKDAEIKSLKQSTLDNNPFNVYQQFIKQRDNLNGENTPNANEFRISYKDIGGAKIIRSFAIKFNGNDGRSQSSRENGKLGGRPRKT